MSAWFQWPPCFYPWPSVVYSQHNSERGSFKPKSHAVFLMSPSSLSRMPSTMRSCSYSGPRHLPLSHFPVLPPHWPFSYSSTLIPQSLGKCCFSPFGKLFQTPMWLTSHFPSGICSNVLRPAFAASPPPCGIAFHSPPTAHPGTPCPSYLTLFFPL